MTHQEAACDVWQVLKRLARRRRGKKAITYSDLATKVGRGPRGMTVPLLLIYKHCIKKKIPPLTVLVVYHSNNPNGKKGYPGKGYQVRRGSSVPEDSYAVYTHDWTKEPKPNF